MAGLLIFCFPASFLIYFAISFAERSFASTGSLFTEIPSITPVTACLGIGVDVTLEETYIHRRGTYEGYP
jgi:hypothetical protein